MKNRILISIFALLSLQATANKDYRSFINLVNYISNDYVNAVEDGVVINEFEYAEMQEFGETLRSLQTSLDSIHPEDSLLLFSEDIATLNAAITAKESPSKVASICANIKQQFLSKGFISTSPNTWPDIVNGKELYEINCTTCHGANGLGDGPKAEGMEPLPANFTEADHISPFHIYNTIALGVEGTSMLPLPHLNEKEKWDIAFYVQTINTGNATGYDASVFPNAAAKVGLDDLALLNNSELLDKLGKDEKALQSLRFRNLNNATEESLLLTTLLLKESREKYFEGNIAEAEKIALQAYFEGFEPVERKIGATNPAIVREVEGEMIAFRSALKNDPEGVDVDAHFNQIVSILGNINGQPQESDNGFWFVFVAAFSVLIREGLEALLIIIAILAALKAFDSKKAKMYVHGGWISAVVLGFLGYFFVGKLIALGGQSRELMEGIGAIIAVVILLSVGFWLHDKSNAKRWNAYIKNKIGKHLDNRNFIAIGLLSFVVVFREAFESVIFLSSLSIGGSQIPIMVATLCSFAIIVVLAIVMIRFAKRLPVHHVFRISSITMLVLAVVLAGKGIKELQEAGWIPVDLLPFNWTIDLVGLYPTLQTVGMQLLTLALGLLIVMWNRKRAANA